MIGNPNLDAGSAHSAAGDRATLEGHVKGEHVTVKDVADLLELLRLRHELCYFLLHRKHRLRLFGSIRLRRSTTCGLLLSPLALFLLESSHLLGHRCRCSIIAGTASLHHTLLILVNDLVNLHRFSLAPRNLE